MCNKSQGSIAAPASDGTGHNQAAYDQCNVVSPMDESERRYRLSDKVQVLVRLVEESEDSEQLGKMVELLMPFAIKALMTNPMALRHAAFNSNSPNVEQLRKLYYDMRPIVADLMLSKKEV